MNRQRYKVFLSKYSKWFQFLEHFLGPVTSIDLIVGILGLIYQNNFLLAIFGLIASVYVLLYFITLLVETIYHGIKSHQHS
ncbi:MAG: hypothetical protein LKF37_10535 [Lentilactobacillus diolivorans]|nr:hypothetical protein [Lentilactobacillus diolivorans]RRG03780.1 MAG: hypothetical protein DUD34_02500 [Lactobacillus sp.]